MSKKGFTLVEVLLVMVLIGLIFGLGIPGIFKLSSSIKNRSDKENIKAVENAAKTYGMDNKNLLKETTCEIDGNNYNCKQIKIDVLIENDYLAEDLQDKFTDKCIYIYRFRNNIEAKVMNFSC